MPGSTLSLEEKGAFVRDVFRLDSNMALEEAVSAAAQSKLTWAEAQKMTFEEKVNALYFDATLEFDP